MPCKEAQKILDQLIKQANSEYVSPVNLARPAFSLAEDDLGLRYLEEAYEKGAGRALLGLATPWFESVRSDPRFASLLKRLGLSE